MKNNSYNVIDSQIDMSFLGNFKVLIIYIEKKDRIFPLIEFIKEVNGELKLIDSYANLLKNQLKPVDFIFSDFNECKELFQEMLNKINKGDK